MSGRNECEGPAEIRRSERASEVTVADEKRRAFGVGGLERNRMKMMAVCTRSNAHASGDFESRDRFMAQ